MKFITTNRPLVSVSALAALLALVVLVLLSNLMNSNAALAQSEARVARLTAERSTAGAGLIAQALSGVAGHEAVYRVLDKDENVTGLEFRLARALAAETKMTDLTVVQACVPVSVISHEDRWMIGFTLNPYASPTDIFTSYGGSW